MDIARAFDRALPLYARVHFRQFFADGRAIVGAEPKGDGRRAKALRSVRARKLDRDGGGEAYDKLHWIVRTAAHFSEFALLGALFCWCYRAYTRDKTFLFLPVGLLVLVPIVDEFLQRSSAGRVADIADMLVDTAGGLCGFSFAL